MYPLNKDKLLQANTKASEIQQIDQASLNLESSQEREVKKGKLTTEDSQMTFKLNGSVKVELNEAENQSQRDQ